MSIGKSERYISRMTKGDPIMKVGSIWYGVEPGTTVSGISYFGNKQMTTLLPIRTESAISFSTSKPPIDTLQIELIVNYSRFRTHIQRLTAQTQISPVIPIQNPVVAAIAQPVQTNKEVYVAYGFGNVNESDIKKSIAKKTLMKMYSTAPVHMRIDGVHIETIPGSPRDVRILLKVTRVLTANIYGDKVKYVKTMEDAVSQFTYINSILEEDGDNRQGDAIAAMVGIDPDAIRHMMDEMETPLSPGEDLGSSMRGVIAQVIAPDIYAITLSSGRNIIAMPYGVECLNGLEKLRLFELDKYAEDAGVYGELGRSIEEMNSFLEVQFGFMDYINGLVGEEPSSNVDVTVVEKGPIHRLDSVYNSNDTDTSIHYCLINHEILGDLGNTLISLGHGFPTSMYDSRLVPSEYDEARTEAMTRVAEEIERATSVKESSSSIKTWDSYEVSPAALVLGETLSSPSAMRAYLRGLTGRNE